MLDAQILSPNQHTAVVIGSGIGGLATALRLSAQGLRVIVLERHATPGGKMRTLPTVAGPVDAGPTVLTLRDVFDDLFAAGGARIEDHLTLHRQSIIARHFWPDGSTLDLYSDPRRNIRAIQRFAGTTEAEGFSRFCADTRTLLDAFDGPMMRAAAPSVRSMAARVASRPGLVPKMAPLSTMAARLKHYFQDPRLQQLFGRYATYVGGSPYQSPALLSLIWPVEERGVWCVEGGMHRLAQALVTLAERHGATFTYNAHVAKVVVDKGRVKGVVLADGHRIAADLVVFNGDPRALAQGALGPDLTHVAPQTRDDPRSLSARVWAFAAKPQGLPLAHHNVFFTADPKAEFDALAKGDLPADQTLYICAQDRGDGLPNPRGPERFEIIANAAPLTVGQPPDRETEQCQTHTFQTLARFGLHFDPLPQALSLTTPQGFEALFPQTAGSLYGQSPHGMMAAFRRPTAKTPVTGLYLAGGGAHPGAGVPMAALSGKHAAEVILRDLASTLPSRPTVMPGGISTA